MQRKLQQMSEKTSFGGILKKTRIDKGLSQEDFAKILGTSKQVVSRYENNQRTPKITTVMDYADKLGMPPDFFICGGFEAGGRVAEKHDMAYTVYKNNKNYRELLEESVGLSEEEIQSLISLIRTMKNKK